MLAGIILSFLLLLHTHSPSPAVVQNNHVVAKKVIPSPTPTATPTPTPTLTPTPLPTATPTPTNTPIPSPPNDYEAFFDQYSNQYSVDKNLLKKIAACESGINPASNGGIYGGMFQFDTSTWISTRTQMGLDTDPDLRFSAKDAIEAAAFKISHGGARAWANCL